jgi:hypothetical protein
MKALRGLFLVGAFSAACFSDNSVKRHVAIVGRVFTLLFTVLFVIAEAMELMS